MDIRGCLLIVILFLSSCSSISGIPNRSSNVKSELDALKNYFSPSVIAAYPCKPIDSTAQVKPAGDNSPPKPTQCVVSDADKKTYRDEIISARIRAIDLNFNEFIQNISAENKKLNIGTDSVLLLLGSAGAVSTVSSSQAILSATSATITGAKTSIDKNAYYESTLSALVSQMLANRKTVQVNIYAGMQLEVKDYPLMRALIDLEDYFQAGTIIGAVSEITKEAGKQKAKAEEKIADIVVTNKYVNDDASKILVHFWMPDGATINSDNQKKINLWLKNKKIADSIVTFLYADKYSKERLDAIKELNL